MNNLNIKIRTKTWNKDSYGLFDYENDDVNRQNFSINSQGILIRDHDYVKFEAEKTDMFSYNYAEDYLVSIFHKESTFFKNTNIKVVFRRFIYFISSKKFNFMEEFKYKIGRS